MVEYLKFESPKNFWRWNLEKFSEILSFAIVVKPFRIALASVIDRLLDSNIASIKEVMDCGGSKVTSNLGWVVRIPYEEVALIWEFRFVL